MGGESAVTAARQEDHPRIFCRRCKHLLPEAEFYAGNRSCCKACKARRAAERRRADPEGTAAARRVERARGRLRAEASTAMLQRVLTDGAQVWERLCCGDIEAVDARGEFYALIAEAFRGLEDEFGISPGTGLEALTRRKRKGYPGNPA
jgi:hypothetical protein